MLADLLHIFQVMEYVLSIGPMEWYMVLEGHLENYPGVISTQTVPFGFNQFYPTENVYIHMISLFI